MGSSGKSRRLRRRHIRCGAVKLSLQLERKNEEGNGGYGSEARMLALVPDVQSACGISLWCNQYRYDKMITVGYV